MRANSSRAALFRKRAAAYAAISGNFLGKRSGGFPAIFLPIFTGNFSGNRNPLAPQASPIPEPRQRVSCRPRFDFSPDMPEAFE
jgi:hypothetical protein